MERSKVPNDRNIQLSVWAMKMKRDLITYKITKFKAILNVHSGKQIQGLDYFEIYSPVAT